MIAKRGYCVKCQKETLLENRKHGLCPIHNRERTQSQGAKMGLKRQAPLKTRRKATGEAELFMALWAVRPHYCENCRVFLGNEPRVHYFSHIKGKGAHPELRLKPENIQLLCVKCHDLYDRGTREQYLSRKQ